MKVLVTGANGQLGTDVAAIFTDKHEVHAYGHDGLDITNDISCQAVISKVKPDVIVHCAAYTSVDLAEKEIDAAYKVNAVGTRNLLQTASLVGAKFCYISTDYVFDGMARSPYQEYDNTNPQSIYGKSKRAGELLVQSLSMRYYIVRTSWVFGQHGNNFVKTMLKLGKEKESLKVVHDQVGSPTYTLDLAAFLMELVETERYGIYHASNSGFCTWYEFAMAIFEETRLPVRVEPCTTEDYPRPAPRPKYSVMDHLAIRINGFNDLRHWREGLRAFLNDYREESK